MPSTLIYFICELRTVMFLLSVCQYWTQVLDIVTSSLFHLCHRWSSLAHNRWVLRVGHYRNQLRTWLGWIMNFLILSNKLYDNATENPYRIYDFFLHLSCQQPRERSLCIHLFLDKLWISITILDEARNFTLLYTIT